jgi:hypothetical protein
MGVSVFSFFSENWPFVSRRELIENWSVGPSSPGELRLRSPSFASRVSLREHEVLFATLKRTYLMFVISIRSRGLV